MVAASSLLFFLALYVGLPALRQAGASWFAAFNLVLALPTGLLGAAALVACRVEGYPVSWPALRDRLRLGRPDPSTWLWTAALAVFMRGGPWSSPLAFVVALAAAAVGRGDEGLGKWAVGLALFLGSSWVLWQAGPWLGAMPLHPRPQYLSDFLSRFGPGEFMGIPLPGRWWVAAYYAGFLLCNVMGEELWWRGYLLPRQEMAHGRAAWLVHGALWAAFHRAAWLVHGALWAAFHLFFQWTLWDLVRMLPTCCALAFVAQHRRNTWPGVFGHAVGNSPLLLQIVGGIMRAPAPLS